MADTGIMATTAQVQALVGANASATYNAEAYINIYIAMVESYVNCVTRYNWSDAYAALNTDVQGILRLASATGAALLVLNADLSGTGLTEMQTRYNLLYEMFSQAIKRLDDIKVKDFMSGA